MNDPRAGMENLKERLAHFDRETLVALLSQRQDIDEKDVNRIIDEMMVVRERFRKFIAAPIAQLLYRYNRDELLTMWSLSLPQVAATLVAYETVNGAGEGLISEEVSNSIICLIFSPGVRGRRPRVSVSWWKITWPERSSPRRETMT